MQPVITVAESRRLDAEASESIDVLMDRAGLAVALEAVAMGAGYGSQVAVLAGKGNNGGDGYVAARHLARRGVAVTVYALADPDPDSAAGRARVAAGTAGVRLRPLGGPASADLVIDALFGSGFRGSLPDVAVAWAEAGMRVLAVDVPSGLDADRGFVHPPTTFSAERTVTFHALKPGHLLGDGPDHTGRIRVADIGLPRARAEFHIVEADDTLRPLRRRDDHKWSAGSVLVVGGAPGMSGAPLLAARAALRFGAGAVRLVVPAGVVDRVATSAPEIMVDASRGEFFTVDDAADIAALQERFVVLVVGPGLGSGHDAFVRALLDQWPAKRVVDADALGALRLASYAGPDTVLTPHAAEWRRLSDAPPSYRGVSGARGDSDLTILLKGSPTFVVDDTIRAVTTGGPELATIGTGDVLAGMIGALMARGIPGSHAAVSAAYWHGVAGAELAATGTVTADRLADAIGRWAW
jgi:hydroxyethylthiazole kinase-like uncharacterized protein yjeF